MTSSSSSSSSSAGCWFASSITSNIIIMFASSVAPTESINLPGVVMDHHRDDCCCCCSESPPSSYLSLGTRRETSNSSSSAGSNAWELHKILYACTKKIIIGKTHCLSVYLSVYIHDWAMDVSVVKRSLDASTHLLLAAHVCAWSGKKCFPLHCLVHT